MKKLKNFYLTFSGYLVNEPMSIFKRLRKVFCDNNLNDGYGFINDFRGLNVVTERTLPKLTNKDYRTIVNERAQDFINKYENIAVSYSGGVDSSLIVVALLQNGIKPNNLTLIHTIESVAEFPRLFNKVQSLGVATINKDDYLDGYHAYQEKDFDVILTGCVADMVWLHEVDYNYDNYNGMDWKDFLKLHYIFNNITEYFDNDIAIIEYFAKSLGWNSLRTKHDLYALKHFGLKWDVCVENFDIMFRANNIKSNLEVFYNTQDFQDWSFTNQEYLREFSINNNNPRLYKKESKEIIYDFIPDSDYLNHKIKSYSWIKQYSYCKYPDTKPLTSFSNKPQIYFSGILDNEGYTLEQYYSKEDFKNYSHFLDEYTKSNWCEPSL